MTKKAFEHKRYNFLIKSNFGIRLKKVFEILLGYEFDLEKILQFCGWKWNFTWKSGRNPIFSNLKLIFKKNQKLSTNILQTIFWRWVSEEEKNYEQRGPK